MSMKKVLNEDQEGVIIQVGEEYLVVTAFDKDTAIMQAKLCSSKEEAMDYAKISEGDMQDGGGLH